MKLLLQVPGPGEPAAGPGPAATVSEVLRVRLPEGQLVGQEGQAPPGALVPDLLHHLLQGVDVLPEVLQRKPQSAFTPFLSPGDVNSTSPPP